mgnify:CR=1 FL=1
MEGITEHCTNGPCGVQRTVRLLHAVWDAAVRLTNTPPDLRFFCAVCLTVTGTPGNGASFFLYYLLARLLALPEPPPYILWEHVSDPTEMVR